MYYVYLLQEEESSKHYVGYTKDLKQRMEQHKLSHQGYTSSGKWKLVYYEAYLSKVDAQERERKLKQDGRSRRYILKRTERSQEICFEEN